MRLAGLWIIVSVFALAVAGCTRRGPPSPEYAQAQAEFSALYGQHLEDAYLRPEMAGIEARLEQVPKNSSDFPEATALLLRIRSGRERVEGQRAEREELVRRAREPVPGAGTFERPPAPPPVPAEKAPEPEAPDAGAEQPVQGMPLAEVTRRWSDCFLSGEAIEVVDKGPRPTWKLRDSVFCRQRHPGFGDRILVEEAGTILVIAERSKLSFPDAGK